MNMTKNVHKFNKNKSANIEKRNKQKQKLMRFKTKHN